MSVKIGVVEINGAVIGELYASTGGVEVNIAQIPSVIKPADARNLAMLLRRAAEEVDDMRERHARRGPPL